MLVTTGCTWAWTCSILQLPKIPQLIGSFITVFSEFTSYKITASLVLPGSKPTLQYIQIVDAEDGKDWWNESVEGHTGY